MFECQICGKKYKTLRVLGIHIAKTKDHAISIAEYYEKYMALPGEGLCLVCDNKCSLKSLTKGYHTFCSPDCVNISPMVREKIKKTCIEKYGASSPAGSKEVSSKMKKTNKERYGVDYPLQNTGIKKKRDNTMLERYGTIHAIKNPESLEKRRNTTRERYGVDHHLQNPEILEKQQTTNKERYGHKCSLQGKEVKIKREETMTNRYGYIHALQNPELHSKQIKSAFKAKEFIMPSGKKYDVQGYEPQAIQLLLDNGFNENEIILIQNQIPVIKYIHNNKPRIYFPDIWLPSINTVIEVKSTYTMEADCEVNLIKHEFSEQAGYDHHFMIL